MTKAALTLLQCISSSVIVWLSVLSRPNVAPDLWSKMVRDPTGKHSDSNTIHRTHGG